MYRTYTGNNHDNYNKNHFNSDCCNNNIDRAHCYDYDDDFYADWDNYEMWFDSYMGCYSDDC